ncbi:Mitochondrial carrier [Venustampulla echinocandica]|uniref:Mitochondrial carrier n=1 Tax=Venustampulla echinocandica TaxID=2656787 RepID=A0A370TF32_9HELO|nr:Mitochondrial carrier [Venustampulla echinocandica]RDL33281.1 Mitochondrial carrier [Venustampulla echinocandica]
MPFTWGRHPSVAEQHPTSFDPYDKENNQDFPDHSHDRIHGDEPVLGVSPTMVMIGDSPEADTDVEVDITAGQKMLSAMSGSLLTSLLVTPLDVVRIRLQSQPTQSPLAAIQKLASSSPHSLTSLPPNLGVTTCCREVFFANNNGDFCLAAPKVGEVTHSSGAVGCAVEETERRSFNSTFDGLRKIARNEGVTTLWRGLSPTLVMTIPANIIYFTNYDWLRFSKQSPINRHVSDGYAPLVAGALARTFAAGVVSPIEMFRTRMQASRSNGTYFAETVKGIGEMVSTHGYTSLWRGLTLTLWRDVPFSGIYWWGYETIKGALKEVRERERGRRSSRDNGGARDRPRTRSQSRENHTEAFTDSFIAGAASGAVASTLTMPFDVGKTRQQVFVDSTTPTAAGAKRVLAPEERSMPRFLWHIFSESGISALWRGWIPRTLKVAPACAIMISCYEVGKRTFKSLNERAERKREGI